MRSLMKIRARRSRLVIGLIGVLALLATLFSSTTSAQASATPRTWFVQVGQQSGTGAIQGMSYGPPTVWINVGDTVQWRAASIEPHTVSFINAAHPAVNFNPTISYMVTRTSQTWISAPGQFRNSGIMTTKPDPGLGPAQFQYTSYSLKFTGIGTYKYLCYIHGQMMSGTVYVRKAGTAYPASQGTYDWRAQHIRESVIADGLSQWDHTFGLATSHHVYIGASDMRAMVMRFVPSTVHIGVGESVTFDMAQNMGPVPHTVTFGTEPPAPFIKVGNPSAYAGGNLSSGVLLAPGFGPPGSSTFTVTFTTAGTYAYKCMFHDGMGMRGSVTVG